jgi:hypothetical protein
VKRAVAVVVGLLIAMIGAHVDAIAGPGVVTVDSGVPGGATAVLTNLTMVDGASAGFITAAGCDDVEQRAAEQSSGNHTVGAASANLAVVPVDDAGRFCMYHQRSVDLLSDVLGYVAPDAGGLRFRSLDPVRLLDTRTSDVTPLAGVVRVETHAPTGTQAVLVNVAMASATAAGYVTAERCSRLVDGPQAWSNGNHVAVAASSNLAVVPVDPDGSFCIYRQRAVQLIVDLQGSFAAGDDGFGMEITEPHRVLDTRTGPTPSGGDVVRVEAGAGDAAAVLVNITMVDGDAPGYITADRCSRLVAGAQAFSNGNHVTGAAVSNLSVVPVDPDGSFCIYRQRAVQMTVDVQGSFSDEAAGSFHLVEPRRMLDTRPALPTTSCESVVHIGDSTSVGLVSTSILPDPSDRVDAQYRRVGVADPRMEISGARSIVERLPGQTNAYEAAQRQIAAGFDGCWVFALGTTDTANVAAGSNVSRRTRIDMMMDLVAGAPVLWVNTRTLETTDPWGDQNMQAWNAELVAAAERYPNLHVYDWASAAQPAWFSADKVHYTPEGYRQRGHLIADALAAAYPG